MDAEFVVVGGGIGGAVLAAMLGRGGKRVVVLEKNLAAANLVRPEVLWPATIDVLFSLIPRPALENEVVLPMQGVELHDGRRVIPLVTPRLLAEAGVQPWFTDPARTREALLRLDLFELRRGIEVIQVLKEGQRVVGVRTRNVATGEEGEVRATWTIGDDGARSLVREACEIDMKTRMFPVDFLCFGFPWPRALPEATAHVWLNRETDGSGLFALLAMPVSEGNGAGLVVARPRLFDDAARAASAWKSFCAADPLIEGVVGARQFPGDFVRVRRPWGHARRYGTEGAILMGDAAHPVSPAGGQGANMSVADARALAELVLAGEPSLLEAYERARRPANERSIAPTRWAARVMGLPQWCFPVRIFSFVLRHASRHPAELIRALRFASTAYLSDPPRG